VQNLYFMTSNDVYNKKVHHNNTDSFAELKIFVIGKSVYTSVLNYVSVSCHKNTDRSAELEICVTEKSV
jgi:hypothetical protein